MYCTSMNYQGTVKQSRLYLVNVVPESGFWSYFYPSFNLLIQGVTPEARGRTVTIPLSGTEAEGILRGLNIKEGHIQFMRLKMTRYPGFRFCLTLIHDVTQKQYELCTAFGEDTLQKLSELDVPIEVIQF